MQNGKQYLSSKETICMELWIQFSLKNIKKNSPVSPAEFALSKDV